MTRVLASMKYLLCSIAMPPHSDFYPKFSIHEKISIKNQSFLNFVYTALAEYTLFLSIQFISGSMINHQVKRHKYIKTGTKILSFSIKLD